MKFSILDEQGELRPYVLCEGNCNQVIREGGVVLRTVMKGMAVVKAYCWRCDPGGGLSRSLGEWLMQLKNNSVGEKLPQS